MNKVTFLFSLRNKCPNNQNYPRKQGLVHLTMSSPSEEATVLKLEMKKKISSPRRMLNEMTSKKISWP